MRGLGELGGNDPEITIDDSSAATLAVSVGVRGRLGELHGCLRGGGARGCSPGDTRPRAGGFVYLCWKEWDPG